MGFESMNSLASSTGTGVPSAIFLHHLAVYLIYIKFTKYVTGKLFYGDQYNQLTIEPK